MRTFLRTLKKEQGFTLVELMVVVAIIGILSAVAIPNFKKYQAKTKTSEAKLQLASIYSAETTLQADYDAFGTCLDDAGYIPPADANYYAIGFSVNNTTANGIINSNSGTGSTNCTSTTDYAYPANKSVGGFTAAITDLGSVAPPSGVTNPGGFGAPLVDNNGSYFTAGAIGAIDSENNTAATASKWIINHNKALIEVNKGY